VPKRVIFLNGKLTGVNGRCFGEGWKENLPWVNIPQGKKTGKWFFWDAKMLKEVGNFVDVKSPMLPNWNGVWRMAIHKQ